MSIQRLRLFEVGSLDLSPAELAAIQRALEGAGVEFTNSDEPGVRLRKHP
jgi:hypothetical protein